MKIAFNVSNSGLGNNGGSRTILLCKQALESLDHSCDIVGTEDNFTWFDHKPIINYVPHNIDSFIATACTTVTSTMMTDVPIKAWYIRAHETWAMTEENLIKLYNAGLINLVNSKGLQKQLEGYGVKSDVVYQGIDLNIWIDKKLRKDGVIRIGCLYTRQPRKRWKDFVHLANILGIDGYEYISIGNATPKEDFLTESYVNKSSKELVNIYSSCNIWFAPTENEGLHNVPMEAALCGCLVVCSDHPLNGMVYDYAFDRRTAMVYEFGNIEQAAKLIKNPDWFLIGNMQYQIQNYIGTREDNMRKMVEMLKNKRYYYEQ